MQIKTTSCHVTPVKMTIIKMTTNNYHWQGCGERGPSYTVGGNISCCSHCTAWMSQKTKCRTIIWPSNFTPGCILKKNTNLKRYKTLMTLMFIAALFIIPKIWKQPKCPSTDEWTEKTYTYMHIYTHTHTMKYCSVCVKVTLLYLTLCYPTDCSPPGFSDHGHLQARILEWVAIPFSQGIILTQGSNLGLLHCRQILYHLSQWNITQL